MYDPAIFLLSVYILKRNKTYIHTKILYTPVFIATLVIIANDGHSPNVYQLMNEWIWCLHTKGCVCACWVASVVSDSVHPCGLQPARLLCPWDSLGKNTRVDCHTLFQGIFPAQGSNLHLMSTCIGRWVLYHLRYLGNKVAQSCLTLHDSRDCSLPGSCVHGLFQTRILEWVAMPFSRGSSQPGDRTQVSHMAGGFFTSRATREALEADTKGSYMAV